MRDVNEAWRVLSDSTQRAAYDRSRREGTLYEPPSPPPSLRSVTPANFSDFGARRAKGGTCLVSIGVALVLLFALGVLGWALDEQLNFAGIVARTVSEVNALLPTRPSDETKVALDAATPTPDPRCRDGCETPPSGCVVKGDVESGTRFFYLPNDDGYAGVRVNTDEGDRWFCALNDAQAAGWTRKAPTSTPTIPPPPELFTTAVARRNFVVCAENAALHEGPGDDFAIVQNAEPGARLAVTGVNGEWSVVAREQGVVYIRTLALCAPPTRVPGAPQPTAAPAVEAATPSVSAATLANPAAGAFKYPAPLLVIPTYGEKYWCKRELILQWSAPPAPLAGDEFFLVESKLVDDDHWQALWDWTKESRVTLNPSRDGGECDAVWWGNTGVYEWRVSIVRGNKEMPTYLSPFSELSRINYSQ